MADLNKCRQELDVIDSTILELFERRMDVCKEVAQYKIETGKKVLDIKREEQKINTMKEKTANPEYKQSVGELTKHLMTLSRQLQYKLVSDKENMISFKKLDSLNINSDTKVAYFGVPGTHTEQAMINYFGENIKSVNKPSFIEVMEEVKAGNVDYGVLPIENSSTGGINDIYNIILNYDNYIVDEIDLIIKQALIGVPGAKLEDIKSVYSHSQGLMQCSKFLEENSQIAQYAYESTAASAKKIKEDNDKTQAAIAGQRAAKVYGLDVIKESCNNNEYNKTRFMIISSKPVYLKKSTGISMCFEIPHQSGSLYDVLSHLKFNDINMTKIESSPIQGKGWEYRFFVDVEGSLECPSVKNAISAIKTETEYFKILGTYSDEQMYK